MNEWKVERIVNFDLRAGDFCKLGFVHFGFHDRAGKHYALAHQQHFLALVSGDGAPVWTVASEGVFPGVPNITADLSFPIYIDSFSDGTLIASNFGDSRLYSIDPARMKAHVFVDGQALGMRHAGNCVVDKEGCLWVNEVDGCRIWRFGRDGRPILTLGDGTPGFQKGEVGFGAARFNWIYDIRMGPDGNIYVLDSRNFAVRVVDVERRRVRTLAGTGRAGYDGDGGIALSATFGSDPRAQFDGPISLSLDEQGNVFVGDRFNHVVRMISSQTGLITTIAGAPGNVRERGNCPQETDPLRLNLPKISSMDYYDGRLLVPTDLADGKGDLVVLKRGHSSPGRLDSDPSVRWASVARLRRWASPRR